VADQAESTSALVERQYTRRVAIALVAIIATWHCTNDLVATLGGLRTSRAPAVPVAAWLLFAGLAGWLSVRLLRGDSTVRYPWRPGGVLLAISTAVGLAVGPDELLSSVNWGWGVVGWLGLVVFWRRPLVGVLLLLAANALLTLALVLLENGVQRGELARYLMIVVGTASLQLGLAGTVQALRGAAGWIAAAAAAGAQVSAAQAAADQTHEVRRARLLLLREGVTELLAGLAYGNADPGEETVRRACATEAARLRRLVVETDDVPDPLLHELRACADVAERAGVLVDLVAMGAVADLPVQIRRALTEPPIAVLSAARSHARVTVTGARGEVTVSVLADADLDPADIPAAGSGPVEVGAQRDGDLLWVEARTRAR
jgi:hypothetical protein